MHRWLDIIHLHRTCENTEDILDVTTSLNLSLLLSSFTLITQMQRQEL